MTREAADAAGQLPNLPILNEHESVQKVGLLLVAGDRGFATASGDDSVGVFDVSTNKLLKKIPGGVGPDAIIYDDKLRLIYAADHAGKTGTLIDPVMMSVVGTVQLGGVAEYAQADPQSGLIYQNDEDTNELVVVDPQKQMVTQRYKLGEGTGPSGLAYDPGNRRLFVTCDNNKLIVLNADTGQVVATLPIGSGVDGASYDRFTVIFSEFGETTQLAGAAGAEAVVFGLPLPVIIPA